MTNYLVFTNTAGEMPAATIEEARQIASSMKVPDLDQPRIFRFLPGCSGSGCTCGGQIHPRSVEVAE